MVAMNRDRWWSAAALVAAATFIKAYPLAQGLLFAALYIRQFSWRFVVMIIACFAIPFAFQYPDKVVWQYENWFEHLQQSDIINRDRPRSVDHLLDVVGVPISIPMFQLLSTLAGVAILGLCIWYTRQTENRSDLVSRCMMLFSMWVILFGPATEAATYAVAAPVVGWALVESTTARRNWFVRIYLFLSLLLMGPLCTDLPGPLIRKYANEHGSQPAGAILLLIYLLLRFRKPLATVQ